VHGPNDASHMAIFSVFARFLKQLQMHIFIKLSQGVRLRTRNWFSKSISLSPCVCAISFEQSDIWPWHDCAIYFDTVGQGHMRINVAKVINLT